MRAEHVAQRLGGQASSLLVELVEVARNNDGDSRFLVSEAMGPNTHLSHASRYSSSPPRHAVAQLQDSHLLRRVQRAAWTLTPLADEVYAVLIESVGQALDQTHARIVLQLESESFVRRYPRTAERLNRAIELLDSGDERRATDIGHAVREAMQYFPEELAGRLNVDVSAIPFEQTANRLGEVFGSPGGQRGSSTARVAIEALADYWRKVADLTQRQEHGASREGEVLRWEDSRRVLWLAVTVVFEVDRYFP